MTARVRKLVRRDGDRCRWCGIRLVLDAPQAAWNRLTVDHLVPRSAGGTDALVNLTLACKRCNNRRGPMSVEEWLAHPYLARRRAEVAAPTGRDGSRCRVPSPAARDEALGKVSEALDY